MKIALHSLSYHHKPTGIGEKAVFYVVKFLRYWVDLFFGSRHGHRAVVIETVAAIPGMVGGALLHFKCLRHIQDDKGWIQTLLDEASNERMHLLSFLHVARPTRFERVLIFVAQFGFTLFYTLLYVCSPRLAHRFTAYLEEEAIISYTHYLRDVEEGRVENSPAPELSITYWGLSPDARLDDLIKAVRLDECHHRDVNHTYAGFLSSR